MNTKAASERYQRQVLELSKQAGNETCSDCGGRYPRWASWNLGIFLCVNCAGVHRKMGTHISKIKSLTLDTWTKEQVEKMREGGNVKNNAKYNPDERRNRPPANIDEGERNSELERFIFDKYKGRFMDKKPPPVPSKDLPTLRPPNANSHTHSSRRRVTEGLEGYGNNGSIPRSRTAPIPTSWEEAKRAASVSPVPQSRLQNQATGLAQNQQQGQVGATAGSGTVSTDVMNRAAPLGSSTLSPPTSLPMRSSSATLATNATTSTPMPSSAPSASSSVFDDLLSLSHGNGATSQPPLQMHVQQPMASYNGHSAGNPWASLATQQQAILSPMMVSTAGPSSYFQQGQQPQPQPQQQQSSYLTLHQQQQQPQPSFFAQQPGQERSASLGNMAFSPSHQQSYSPQPGANPFYGTSGAQMMGQQAFGQYTPQQQQQQQSQAPQFGAFANSMMPTQQQPPQQYANGWQQQQQQYNNSNMWG